MGTTPAPPTSTHSPPAKITRDEGTARYRTARPPRLLHGSRFRHYRICAEADRACGRGGNAGSPAGGDLLSRHHHFLSWLHSSILGALMHHSHIKLCLLQKK